jgi:hypothetical protein
MNITAPTTVTDQARMGNAVTKSIRSVAAALAVAAAIIPFAAPHAGAMPPRDTADKIADLKAECNKQNRGRWSVDYVGSTVNGYLCTWWSTTGKKQWGAFYDENGGWDQVICYRLDIESPWICV